MSLSLKQISDKYGITRAGIYKRLDKLPVDFKKNHMQMVKGKWIVDDAGSNLLGKQRKFARPKHYVDHVTTKLEYKQALKQEREKNSHLINVLVSQRHEINQGLDKNTKSLNKFVKALKGTQKAYLTYNPRAKGIVNQKNKELKKAHERIYFLKHRGFWARIFNKGK